MTKDGRPGREDEPQGRRAATARRTGSTGRQRGFVERATAKGRSGHGSESVRPYLRDELRLKALLPTPFPMPETLPGKDDHHR